MSRTYFILLARFRAQHNCSLWTTFLYLTVKEGARLIFLLSGLNNDDGSNQSVAMAAAAKAWV